MKIEIKLKDSKLCDGCPFVRNLGICSLYHKNLEYFEYDDGLMRCNFKRLKKCIKNNGK